MKYYGKFILYLWCFVQLHFLKAQEVYSEFALSGRGDLVLVGNNKKLQPKVFEAFKKMQTAAYFDGISIELVSAYRSFNHQKNIWNRKYSKFISEGLTPEATVQKIIEYSTIPGTSRHHWGTDIDIFDGTLPQPDNLLVEENYEENGVYVNLKKWMDENAHKFGFYLVYTKDENRKGFKYEPWHYSYLPIAKQMLNDFKLEAMLNLIETSNIKGKTVLTKSFLEQYYTENILDINSILK